MSGRAASADTRGSKRGKPEESDAMVGVSSATDSAATGPQAYVPKSDFEKIMAELKAENEASAVRAVQQMKVDMTNTMVEAMKKQDEAWNQRMGRVEAEVMELKARISSLEEWKPQTEAEVTKVKTALQVVESSSPERVVDREDMDFTRDPDPTIVKVRATEKVSPEAIGDALKVVFDEMGLDDSNFHVEGRDLDKSFNIQFHGTGNLAIRRVAKFLSLQKSEGEWRTFTAKMPDGQPTRIYVDSDKSPRQIRKDILTRKLHKVLKGHYPAIPFFCRKRDGVVSVDWVPFARVSVLSREAHTLEWNLPEAEDRKIDEKLISAGLGAATVTPRIGVIRG